MVAKVELSSVGRTGIITFNRPEGAFFLRAVSVSFACGVALRGGCVALNALSEELRSDIVIGLDYFNRVDLNFGAIILTGKGRAFAAGVGHSSTRPPPPHSHVIPYNHLG